MNRNTSPSGPDELSSDPAGLSPATGRGRGNAPVATAPPTTDPGATLIGANADTMGGPQPVSPTLKPTPASAGSGIPGRPATAAGLPLGHDDDGGASVIGVHATLIGSNAGVPTDKPDSPQPTTTAAANSTSGPKDSMATERTFLLNSAVLNGDPAATLIGVPEAPKDGEDFYDTLVESPEARAAGPDKATGVVIGDYQVIGELGRGGMGVVY